MKQKSMLPIVLIFFAMIAAFLLAPIAITIVYSFKDAESRSWGLANYIAVIKNPYYLQAFRNSFLVSLFSSLFALVASFFICCALRAFSPKLWERLLAFSNMTSNFAGVPLAFAFIILLGNNGVFTILLRNLEFPFSFDLYSWKGLAAVYIYFQLPLAVLVMFPAFSAIRDEWQNAAALLGASPFQFWRYVGLPVLMPCFLGTFSLLFANAMGAYATAYALAGSSFNLVTIRIAQLIAGDIFLKPELAGAMAVLLGSILWLSIWFYHKTMPKTGRDAA